MWMSTHTIIVTLHCCVTESVHVGIHAMRFYDVTIFNNSLHHVYVKRSAQHDGWSTVVTYRVVAPRIETTHSNHFKTASVYSYTWQARQDCPHLGERGLGKILDKQSRALRAGRCRVLWQQTIRSGRHARDAVTYTDTKQLWFRHNSVMLTRGLRCGKHSWQSCSMSFCM